MTAHAPLTLQPGEVWLDMDAQNPHPSRKPVNDFKAAIKEKLREQGLDVEKQLNVIATQDFRGVHVSAELAAPVLEVLESLKDRYPNLQAVRQAPEQTQSAEAGDAPEGPSAGAKAASVAGAVAAAAAAAEKLRSTPEEETPAASDEVVEEQPRPHAVEEPSQQAEQPEAQTRQAQTEANPAAKKELLMRGGAALGAVTLGGVLLNKGKDKGRDAGDQGSRKGRILAAVGAVLAVAVPLALFGKEALSRANGMQR